MTASPGRRGRAIGEVAAARKLLTLVFYGLRDGHIRCLDTSVAPRACRCWTRYLGATAGGCWTLAAGPAVATRVPAHL